MTIMEDGIGAVVTEVSEATPVEVTPEETTQEPTVVSEEESKVVIEEASGDAEKAEENDGVDGVNGGEEQKTIIDLAYEDNKELLRKEKEEALKKSMEEADLPVTEEQKKEEVDKVVDQMTEVIEKNQEKDPSEILAEVAEVFYTKEQEYQKASREKDIEIEVLKKRNQEYVEEINELKYSENRVVVDEEFKYLLNLHKRYKENPKDELTVNRLLKHHIGMISVLEPAIEPEEWLSNIKNDRRKKVLALSGGSQTTTPEPKKPEVEKVIGYAIGTKRVKA